jgi:adenylosuccinate synthase
MLNGVTQLVMTKSDVLSGFESIYACTHYKTKDGVIDYLPYDICEEDIEPVLVEQKGWSEDITKVEDFNQLPSSLKTYIAFLEKELKLNIKYVSVGPDRKQTLVR